MPQLSNEQLQNLAKVTGGVAVLVAIALFVSGTAVPNDSQVGAAVCSGGSCTDNNGTIWITTNAETVTSGGSAIISWNGSGAPSIPGEMLCLGNLSGTCGANPAVFLSVGSGAFPPAYDTFTYNGTLYMTVINGSSDGTSVRTYRWTVSGTGCPAEGGWGNGTACGTAQQTMTMAYLSGLDAHMINGHPYLHAAGWRTYKWTPSGTGCPAGGGWGNGTVCGVTSMYGQFSYSASGGQIQNVRSSNIFESGGNYFVAIPRNVDNLSLAIFKWQLTGTGCPAGGGWGNGNACFTTPWMTGLGTRPNGPVSKFTVDNVDYILTTDPEGYYVRTFRWTPSGTNCPAGGGWGNGTTACGTPAQNIRPMGSTVAQVTGGIYAKPVVGGSPYPYLVVGASNGNNQTLYARLYKWLPAGTSGCPAGGGWGNSTSCGNSYVQDLGTNTGEPGVFVVGSRAFVGYGGRIRVLTPASNCIGDGIGSNPCDSYFQSVGSLSNPKDFFVGTQQYVHGLAGGPNATYKVIRQAGSPANCTVTWSNNSSFTTSSTFSTADSHAGLTTGPLTADRYYRLSCDTMGSNTVTVRVTVTTPTVTITPWDNTATEGTTVDNGTFRLTRTGSTAASLVVTFSLGGTGVRNTDYSLTGASISGTTGLTATIPAPASFVDITVVPRANDAIPQGNKTATMSVVDGASYNLGSPSSAIVNVNDPDVAAPSITACTYNLTASAANNCSLGANPLRVRRGTQTTLSYYVPTIPAGVTCTITAIPSIPGFSADSGGAASWIGTRAVTIPRITNFVLSCSGPGGSTSASKTVGVLPSYREI